MVKIVFKEGGGDSDQKAEKEIGNQERGTRPSVQGNECLFRINTD